MLVGQVTVSGHWSLRISVSKGSVSKVSSVSDCGCWCTCWDSIVVLCLPQSSSGLRRSSRSAVVKSVLEISSMCSIMWIVRWAQYAGLRAVARIVGSGRPRWSAVIQRQKASDHVRKLFPRLEQE